MGIETGVQWAAHTFNPWRGCNKISPGCKHCYAEAFVVNRQSLPVWGAQAPRRIAAESTWRQPLRWNKIALSGAPRPRVFCASLADVFEDYRGPSAAELRDARGRLFRLIEQTPRLVWMLLTKRADRVAHEIPAHWQDGRWPANAWIGFSAESQETFDARWEFMRHLPAPLVFTSMEPMLGPVVLPSSYLSRGQRVWPIVGGESGGKARPFDMAWATRMLKPCQDHGVPLFIKQLGAVAIDGPGTRSPLSAAAGTRSGKIDCAITDDGEDSQIYRRVNLKDGKGGDLAEWPEYLRRRELPELAQIVNQ